MSITNLPIKEILMKRPVVVAVSGPSGAGKDYLTEGARKHFETMGIKVINVQMTTERPHRGERETKVCVSPEEYSRLQLESGLIGDHVNAVRYGYQINQMREAIEGAEKEGAIVIIELNPDKQRNFPQEFKQKLGTDLTAWIGVQTTPDQTIKNMEERGESKETIEARVKIFNEFIEAMKANSNIHMCDNGPINRANAVNDFVGIIETSIKKV